jgi:hypothetical protein
MSLNPSLNNILFIRIRKRAFYFPGIGNTPCTDVLKKYFEQGPHLLFLPTIPNKGTISLLNKNQGGSI